MSIHPTTTHSNIIHSPSKYLNSNDTKSTTRNKLTISTHISHSITRGSSLKIQLAVLFLTIIFLSTCSTNNKPFKSLIANWRQLALAQPQSTTIKSSVRLGTNSVQDDTDVSTPMTMHDDNDNNITITTIALIGERNSGTSWMYSQLQKCYNSTNLTIQKRVTRDKHWFQYNDVDDKDVQQEYHESMLVITQFRNPYQWILAMMSEPHHAPDHQYLDWRAFVTKPWTTKRGGFDLNITNKVDRICKQNFTYDEVISCSRIQYPEYVYGNKSTHFSAKRPFYELRQDGSGIPYGSIVELRKDKILNHLNTSTYPYVKQSLVVQYEELLLHGTSYILEQIESITGVKAACPPVPAQPNRKQRDVDSDLIHWMNQFVDWETEALIGYYPNKILKTTIN